jgi:hypothetical protein
VHGLVTADISAMAADFDFKELSGALIGCVLEASKALFWSF